MRSIARLALLSGAALAAGAGVAGCAGHPPPGEKTLTAVKVRAVERKSAAGAARYSATIEPASHVDVAFKVGGYVESVARTSGVDGRPRLLQEGDRVTRGQVLASVRKSDYVQRLDEARAALAEAVAAQEKAQIDFDRASKLVANGSLSQADFDAARIQLAATKARAEGAKVRVDEASTAVEDARLRAPMDGVVVKRAIEVGALVAPGAVAFSIADTSSVKAVFGVPDTILETLRLGTMQTISVEAFHGAESNGRISRIAPTADPKSRVFEVEINVPNDDADHELKAGMVATLKLGHDAEATTPVAVLPLTAIVRAPGKGDDAYAVYVLEEKDGTARVHLRNVELGEFLGNVIPIRAGLGEGEKVVVLGAALCSDGEQVQVIP